METTRADILVFGSSRANHHYIPEAFEDSLRMTFYNTGRDNTGIRFQIGVLKSLLKRYTPKLIILDYYGNFDKNNIVNDIPSLLPYYRTHEEVRKIIESNSTFERAKLLSEIYPFNSQISSIIIGNLEINKKRYSDDKGYVPLFNQWQAKLDSINIEKTYPIDSSKIYYLREFINLAKKSGAKVFVIYSPIYQYYKMSQEIVICNDICKIENVPFWDFSKDTLFLNHGHLFYDFDHLNQNGAKIFSNIIVEKIKYNLYKTQDNREAAK